MQTQQNQRRTELDARFKAQDAARKAEKERRKEANDASADPTENAEAFCKKFNEDVSGIESLRRQHNPLCVLFGITSHHTNPMVFQA